MTVRFSAISLFRVNDLPLHPVEADKLKFDEAAKMKKNTIICIIAVTCIVIVLFFPITKTKAFSGNGSVLNSEKERIDDCTIAIEIRELTSLVLRYSTNFSFALNGTPCFASEEVRYPVSVSVTKYGDCLISQSYYDEKSNEMKPCSLFYRGDHSYAEIFWEDNYHTLTIE